MKALKIIIALIALLLSLGLVIGCSDAELSGADSESDGGSNISVEGDYIGIMKYTQVEVITVTSGDEVTCYNPSEEGGEDEFLDAKIEVNYSVSLEGDSMTLYSNNTDDYDFFASDLDGKYDALKKEFVYIYPVDLGGKDGIFTLKFYEEDGVVKADGEMVFEHIETGWKNIISFELAKISE